MMLVERRYKQLFYFWLLWTREQRQRYIKLEALMKKAARNIQTHGVHNMFLMWYRYSMVKVTMTTNNFFSFSH